jgi:hypothetical protein
LVTGFAFFNSANEATMRLPEKTPNRALEPTAVSGLRRLAGPQSPRSSAEAQRERWASCWPQSKST